MENGVAIEMTSLLIAIAVGAACGAVFDIFRIQRKVWKCSAAWVHVQDIVCLIVFAFAMIGMVYQAGDGEARWYLFFGAVCGLAVYFLTLSRVLVPLCVKIIRVLLKCLRFILKVVFFPVIFILKIIMKPFGFVAISLRKLFKTLFLRVRGLFINLGAQVKRLCMIRKKQ